MVLRLIALCLITLYILPGMATAQITDNALQHNIKDSPSLEQARNLYNLAQASSASNFMLADSLYSLSLAITHKIAGKNLEYAQTLQNLAELRIILQQFDNVEPMLREVINIKKKCLGANSIEYADALSVLGWYYAVRFNFVLSEQTFDMALKIAQKRAPGSYLYGNILHKAFFLYYFKQNFLAAENCCQQAIDIYKKTVSSSSDRKLIEATGTLAILYTSTERIGQAEKLILELLPIIEQSYGKADYAYSVLRMTLGSIYASYGRQEEAISLLEESIELNKRLFGERHESYFNALNNLSQIYLKTNRFKQAEYLLKKSLEIREDIFSKQSTAYIQGANNLAALYQNMGNYTQAIDMLNQAAEYSKTLLGESSKSYILILYGLANCYNKRQNYEKALAYSNKIEDIIARYNLSDRPEFIEISANNRLVAMRSGKDINNAQQKIEQTAAKLLLLYGEQNTTYQNMVNWLSIYHLEMGNYKLALAYATKDSELIKKYRGKQTTPYLWAICNKSVSYYNLKRWDEAVATLAECLDIVKEMSQNNFPGMTPLERKEYWQVIRRSLSHVEDFILYAIQERYDSPRLPELIYNSNLFARALLLNFEACTQPNLSATWQNVRDNLCPKEAAIEIITVAMDRYNPTLYYAGLILKNGDKSPRMVMLCSKAELEATLNRNSYDNRHTYNLLFKPLEQLLDSVEVVYIAPGELTSKISFAAMRCNDDYLFNKYSICTLLSTKDIQRAKLLHHPFADSSSVALFGGADYGLLPVELAKWDSENSGNASLSAFDTTRGQGFDYLPGSKKEVTQIANILSTHGWKTALHTDIEATKSKFKALSGSNVDVIHVSTHGYYFPPTNKKEEQPSANIFKISDDPLIRSGLLFSGANSSWDKTLEPHFTDNGVLTASEISLIKLNHTRLVVLSACNTALGDIDFREGVYGLQRAFRVAGVGSMLVSLWNIPDDETSVFMTTFYQYLTNKMPIRDAYTATMRKMATSYPKNPKAWAGFVLIE